LGQEYLDRAIRTGAALPGQSANEAGTQLAAGNAAANTGIAIGDASRRMTEPSGWVGAGDAAVKEWKQSLLEQTGLGMQQNRDTQQAFEAEQKRKESSSSGIGAMLGAGAGILGTIYGGPAGGMIGSSIGSSAGKMFDKAEHGGPVGRFRAGGPVPSPEEEDDEGTTTEPVYRPGQDDVPELGREYQPEPSEQTEWPHSDTGNYHSQKWGPNYANGGNVDDIPDYIPQFDPEGKGYDYKQARDAGLSPQPVPHDTVPHWPSREPGSGLLLKGRRHPTFDHGVDVDRREGYGLEMRNGRYYTAPFKGYAEGGDVPDEEEFVDTPDEEMAEPPQGPDDVVRPEMSPSGGKETDDVHALLNEGEFVIPKEVVRWHGEKFFQNLIKKAHDEIAGPQEAEPEQGPPSAMAISPPTFQTAGA
jgi:hypothetical protein